MYSRNYEAFLLEEALSWIYAINKMYGLPYKLDAVDI